MFFTQSPRLSFTSILLTFLFAFQLTACSTEDDLTLQGWYIPSTNRAAVVLVHAFNGNRTGTIYHAALLAKHGYGVLLYDTRAHRRVGNTVSTGSLSSNCDIRCQE